MSELDRVRSEVFAAFLRIFGPDGLRLADRLVDQAQASKDADRRALIAEMKRIAQEAIDEEESLRRMKPAVQVWAAEALVEPGPDAERFERVRRQRAEDLVRLLFFSCQPSLRPFDALASVLRMVFGLAADDVAALTHESTEKLSARLDRALHKIRSTRGPSDRPTGSSVGPRLDATLMILHMVFAEVDQRPCTHERRSDLTHRVIELGQALTELSEYNDPSVHALLALCYLQAARLPARASELDPLLGLWTEDRRLWDRELIEAGRHHFEISIAGEMASYFHLEAAIAAKHVAAEDFEATDWPSVLALWTQLDAIAQSTTTVLQKCLALGMVEGPESGIAELERWAEDPSLQSDSRADALRAFLEARLRA